jgi:branched-chain amino acid transport system permease protein
LTWRRSGGIGVAAAAAILVVALPLLVSGYWVRVATTVLMYVALTAAYNIIAGYAGYPALGNVVFFGLGAYTAGVGMTAAGLPIAVALLLGGVVPVLYAVALGVPILRTRGHYFVMATIGVNEATREMIANLDRWTEGSRGITLPLLDLEPRASSMLFYGLMLALAAGTVVTTAVVARTRLGYGWRAIRANEQAAVAMGVDATRYKVAAWALSACFTGLTGAVYALWTTFIEPAGVFSVLIVVKFTVMLLLGGQGTVLGPVIGAVVVEVLSTLVWGEFPHLHLGIFGVLVVVIVLFVPSGIMDLFTRRWSFLALGRRVAVAGGAR